LGPKTVNENPGKQRRAARVIVEFYGRIAIFCPSCHT
jgi:hypothetical protein